MEGMAMITLTESVTRLAVEAWERTEATGGATVSVWDNELPSYGYMVGGRVKEITFPHAGTDRELFVKVVGEYIDLHWTILVTGVAVSLGVWLNPETDTYHVDISEWYADQVEAERVGRSRGELAIYALGDQSENGVITL